MKLKVGDKVRILGKSIGSPINRSAIKVGDVAFVYKTKSQIKVKDNKEFHGPFWHFAEKDLELIEEEEMDIKYKVAKEFTAKDLYDKYRKCSSFPHDLFFDFIHHVGWKELITINELEEILNEFLDDEIITETEYNTYIQQLIKDKFLEEEIKVKIEVGDILYLSKKHVLICEYSPYPSPTFFVDIISGKRIGVYYSSIEQGLDIQFHKKLSDITDKDIYSIREFSLKILNKR